MTLISEDVKYTTVRNGLVINAHDTISATESILSATSGLEIPHRDTITFYLDEIRSNVTYIGNDKITCLAFDDTVEELLGNFEKLSVATNQHIKFAIEKYSPYRYLSHRVIPDSVIADIRARRAAMQIKLAKAIEPEVRGWKWYDIIVVAVVVIIAGVCAANADQ